MQARLLLIPVSGGAGGGELQRSLIVARALRALAGDEVLIRFLVHTDAPFPRDEFATVPLPGSPTRSESEVAAAIAEFSPHVCLFDSSLRMSALRAARAACSRTVYLSVRPNSRWRGLDPRKRALLDEHWLLAPERLGDAPPWPERLGARLLNRTRFAYFGAVFEPPDTQAAQALLAEHGVSAGRYCLVCPGGAGYVVDGMAPLSLLATVGASLDSRWPILAIDAHSHPLPPGWIALPRLLNRVLMGLIAAARLNVVNGGSLLVQALALGAPCLAVPMQREQAQRIAAFAARRAVLTCLPERNAITHAWQSALSNDDTLQTLREHARALPLRNDLEAIAIRLRSLLPPPSAC